MMLIQFDHPEFLWLLLLAVPIVLLGWWSLQGMEKVRQWTAIAIRLAVLLLLVLVLAGVQLVRSHTDLTVVAVVDRSESARRLVRPPATDGAGGKQPSMEEWLKGWLHDSGKDRKPDDRLGVVTYDGRPTVRSLPTTGAEPDEGAFESSVDGTDTAAAIRLAMALFPADSGKRMLLVWDGNDTTAGEGGSESAVAAAAREAKAAGVPIDVLPLDYHLSNEVMVESLASPAEARRGQTISLRVVLSATRPSSGVIQIRHDGVVIDLTPGEQGTGAQVRQSDWTIQQESHEPPKISAGAPAHGAPGQTSTDIKAGRFVCVRLIEVPMADRGASQFEAVFEPGDSQDTLAANNTAEAFTLVHGKGRVLVVNNVAGQSGLVLPEALTRRGIELEVIHPEGLPTDLAGLLKYDAVILQNVPSDMVTPGQNKMLARYVNDLGGGLVMVGGPDSFGAGGWTNSPVDRVLPIECQVPSQAVLPSGALVIVMDRSGSMGSQVQNTPHSQQEIANEAAVQAISTLYPQDLVGVVAFDDSPKWVVGSVNRLVPGSEAVDVAKRIRSIQPGGGTNIYPGLEQGYEALARLGPEDAAVRHIILLTDGQSQDGEYFKIVGKMSQAGITLSTVGVGDGVNNKLLGDLAKMGGGTYHPIHDPRKLPQIFIKEARLIRKNLVKEQPFVPQLIQTGSPAMAGMTGTPKLRGLVLTGPKNDPRVYMPMVGAEGEPLFAHWQVGLGRSAAFTSDATNRWAVDWLGWDGYPDFWARTVRLVAKPASSRAYDLTTTINGGRIHIRLDAAGQSADEAAASSGKPGTKPAGQSGEAGFVNFLNVAGTVLGPDGSAVAVKLEQTGPGVYEADLPAGKPGNYIVSLAARKAVASGAAAGGEAQIIIGGVNRSRGPELRSFSSNRRMIEQVAMLTGGRVIDPHQTQQAGLFDRQGIVPSVSMRPLWRTLLLWLVALFLIDVAVRRIAWDLPAMWRRLKERLDGLLGLFKAREVRAEVTLAALKVKAAQVNRGFGSANQQHPMPTTDTRKKFGAGETFEPQQDFADAVGGAKVEDQSMRNSGNAHTPKPGDNAGAQPGQTTGRLLDAKRRAQEKMNRPDT